jgi:hypothetical protein
MKYLSKITVIGSMFAILFFVACEKQLDTEQYGIESFETFYKTDEEALQAVTAIYLHYAGTGVQYNTFFLKNLLSDDFWCGGGKRGDNATNEQLNEYSFGTDHPYLGDAFKNYYELIYRSNVLLENVPDYSPVQKQARAEAKVFRALAYIELISMWGTPPFVDHLLLPNEYKQPNGDPEKLWALVETDLTEAISSESLREKSGINDNSSYRITKQYAQALLGKALVFQEKFTEATAILDAVILSGKYDLFRGDYGEMLQYTSENNCESMFELNVTNDQQNTVGFDLMFAMTGWRTDQMALNPASDIYNVMSWGYCCYYQKDLYDAFVAEEGVNGYRLTQTMINYDQMLALGNRIMDGNELYGCEGYFTWKRRHVNGEVITAMDSHNNIRIMRYAEVLLLAAEAHVKGGVAAKAAEYVNAVRTRAHLAPKASVTIDDVVLEKRLELCGESVRYQDMIRWKIADKMGNQGKKVPSLHSNGLVTYGEYNPGDVAGFKTAKHWLLPFPQAEKNLNENINQNEGWGK